MAHAHASSAASPSASPRGDVRGLRIAFGITLSVLVLEAAGGLLTGSVALLADAGHMLTDAGALAVAMLAAWIAARPVTVRKSFGYGRAEILGALANGMLLAGVSVAIAIESLERLATPRAVAAEAMVGIAMIGLAANLVSARILAGSAKKNLNVRAALFHVLGDALGSVAAIAAGVAILLFGLYRADAVAGIVIALLLVASAFRLVRDSVDILLEAAPRHLDLEKIAGEVGQLQGVRSIHDLHIWTVNEGFLAMSGHIDLETGANAEGVRRSAHRLLHQRYDIEHTTIQTEEPPGLLSIENGPENDS